MEVDIIAAFFLFHATGAGSPFGTYGCELTIDEVTDKVRSRSQEYDICLRALLPHQFAALEEIIRRESTYDMLQAAFPRINRNKFDVTCVLFWCMLRGYRLVINTATQSSSAKRTAVLICALHGFDCQTTPIVCLRLERKGKVQPTLLDA